MSKKIVLAYSGGLDTTYCAVHLAEEGWEVHTVAVDCGGFGGGEAERIAQRAEEAGVASHQMVDARRELWSGYLRYLLFGNVLRGGVYPLSVSAERVCQAEIVVRHAREAGAVALAHGSTGAGNDQIRFDVGFRALAPNLEIVTPIRSQGLTRAQTTAYLAERRVEVEAKTTTYSINSGLWGSSIGGRETLDSAEPLPDEAFPGGVVDSSLPKRKLALQFRKGVPVSVDGKEMSPVELVEHLNELGGQHGIGRGHHLGDTILGIKGRIGYEAPAAHLLIQAHRELEKLVLSGRQQWWKDHLGSLYGGLLHEGLFFDPLGRDIEAFLRQSQERVTGTVRMALRPHSSEVIGMESPHSMMKSEIADYGEENRLWDGQDAAGFAKLYGVSQIIANRAGGGES